METNWFIFGKFFVVQWNLNLLVFLENQTFIFRFSLSINIKDLKDCELQDLKIHEQTYVS